MINPVIQQITSELENLQKELAQFKSTVDYLNTAKTTVKSANESVEAAQQLLIKKADELNVTYNSLVRFSEVLDSFVKKIEGINFPERLDKIELGFLETVEILQVLNTDLTQSAGAVFEQIKRIDFNTKFQDLSREVSKTVKSNQDVIQSVKDQKLPEKIDAFEKSITKFIRDSNTELSDDTKKSAAATLKSISDMNIPLRLEKLDANIAGVQASIQNFHNRMESIERNLIDRIKESSDKTLAQLTSMNDKIAAQLLSISETSLKNSKKQFVYIYITWGFLIPIFGLTAFMTYKVLFH
jgi:prefoldin subunit 5